MTPRVTKLLKEPEGPEGPKSHWKPLEASETNGRGEAGAGTSSGGPTDELHNWSVTG